MMPSGQRDPIQKMIDIDPDSAPETKKQLTEIYKQIQVEVATNVETDPEVWREAREFMQAMDEVQERLIAREIDGDAYQRETMALLDGVPQNVLKAASTIQQAIIAAYRNPDPTVH